MLVVVEDKENDDDLEYVAWLNPDSLTHLERKQVQRELEVDPMLLKRALVDKDASARAKLAGDWCKDYPCVKLKQETRVVATKMYYVDTSEATSSSL